MDDRRSRLRHKVGTLFDALQHADREVFIEITDLLLCSWDEAYAHGELTLSKVEACVDEALATLDDRVATLGHLRRAVAYMRRRGEG